MLPKPRVLALFGFLSNSGTEGEGRGGRRDIYCDGNLKGRRPKLLAA
jgi:hypothetical protein